MDMHPHNHETRALWHLELLGCWGPEDAITPAEPEPAPREWDDGEWDDDYWCDDLACTRCSGEGFGEVDDPMWDECDEFCWGPCCACRGTGERRHQWVF